MDVLVASRKPGFDASGRLWEMAICNVHTSQNCRAPESRIRCYSRDCSEWQVIISGGRHAYDLDVSSTAFLTLFRGSAIWPEPVMHQPDIAKVVNPVRPTAESLAQGKKYYGYDCAMCHGKAATARVTSTPATSRQTSPILRA